MCVVAENYEQTDTHTHTHTYTHGTTTVTIKIIKIICSAEAHNIHMQYHATLSTRANLNNN